MLPLFQNAESSESVGSGRSSPAQTWEEARQSSVESISNPSSPSFTTGHTKPQTQPQPLAPRESSYSAILLGTDKQVKPFIIPVISFASIFFV